MFLSGKHDSGLLLKQRARCPCCGRKSSRAQWENGECLACGYRRHRGEDEGGVDSNKWEKEGDGQFPFDLASPSSLTAEEDNDSESAKEESSPLSLGQFIFL